MKAVLDRGAIRVAYAAALTSDVRLVLQYVKVGKGEIVACDGFILARRKIEIEPAESEEVMLVDANTILKAHRMLGGEQLIIESQDEKFALIRSEKSDSPIISTELMQAKFPEYEQIIPQTKRLAYVAVGRDKIAQLVKIADTEYSFAVKVRVREASAPIEIKTGKTEVFLMPYFSPEENWND